MKINEIREKINYKDYLEYTLKQLIRFKNSNNKIDLDVTFNNEEHCAATTPLYFDRFNEEFIKEFLEYNIKFFNTKLRNVDIELENMIK